MVGADPGRPGGQREIILKALSVAGLEFADVGEGRWLTVLPGEHKRAIPVLLELGDRSLTVTSLLAGAPDEDHESVYRLLLQRNERSGPVHFAVDGAGDLLLVGRLPSTAIDVGSVDELLGQVLQQADEVFDAVLRTGFRSYIAAEQRWRSRTGLPPNPVGIDPE